MIGFPLAAQRIAEPPSDTVGIAEGRPEPELINRQRGREPDQHRNREQPQLKAKRVAMRPRDAKQPIARGEQQQTRRDAESGFVAHSNVFTWIPGSRSTTWH